MTCRGDGLPSPGAAAPISRVPVNNRPWHVDEDWGCGPRVGARHDPYKSFPLLVVKTHQAVRGSV